MISRCAWWLQKKVWRQDSTIISVGWDSEWARIPAQMPFQNELSSLKTLLPPSPYPRGEGCGGGVSSQHAHMQTGSKNACKWCPKAQLLQCPPWAFAHCLAEAWYCSWQALSTFCASWSSLGHVLLLPPIFPQVGSYSRCCSQPVSAGSFHAHVKSGNTDWQLTLTGSLYSYWMDHIRRQLNYPNFSFLYYFPNY